MDASAPCAAWAEKRGAHPEGARGAQALRRAPSPAGCARCRGRAHRLSARACTAGDDHGGRQPAARLRYLRRSRPPGLRRGSVVDGRFRRLRASGTRPRAWRHQVERAPLGRLSGGSPAGAAAKAAAPPCSISRDRRRTTSRLRDRAIGLGLKLNEYGVFRTGRWTLASPEMTIPLETRSRAPPRRTCTPRSASTGFRPNCGRCTAKSRRRRRNGCLGLSIGPICAATSTCTPRKPTGKTTSGRWRKRRGKRASSTSRSPITASRWRWRTAWTNTGRSRMPPASGRWTRKASASGCWPASNATSSRMARSISPTTALLRSTSSWPRCTRRSIRTVNR